MNISVEEDSIAHERVIEQGFSVDDFDLAPYRVGDRVKIPGLEPSFPLEKIVSYVRFSNFLKPLRDLVFRNENLRVFEDFFWWNFIRNFRPGQYRELQEMLFNRISTCYSAMLVSMEAKQLEKDSIMKKYIWCMSHATYCTFLLVFSASHKHFDAKFKQDIIDTFHVWLFGQKAHDIRADDCEWEIALLEKYRKPTRAETMMHIATQASMASPRNRHITARTQAELAEIEDEFERLRRESDRRVSKIAKALELNRLRELQILANADAFNKGPKSAQQPTYESMYNDVDKFGQLPTAGGGGGLASKLAMNSAVEDKVTDGSVSGASSCSGQAGGVKLPRLKLDQLHWYESGTQSARIPVVYRTGRFDFHACSPLVDSFLGRNRIATHTGPKSAREWSDVSRVTVPEQEFVKKATAPVHSPTERKEKLLHMIHDAKDLIAYINDYVLPSFSKNGGGKTNSGPNTAPSTSTARRSGAEDFSAAAAVGETLEAQRSARLIRQPTFSSSAQPSGGHVTSPRQQQQEGGGADESGGAGGGPFKVGGSSTKLVRGSSVIAVKSPKVGDQALVFNALAHLRRAIEIGFDSEINVIHRFLIICEEVECAAMGVDRLFQAHLQTFVVKHEVRLRRYLKILTISQSPQQAAADDSESEEDVKMQNASLPHSSTSRKQNFVSRSLKSRSRSSSIIANFSSKMVQDLFVSQQQEGHQNLHSERKIGGFRSSTNSSKILEHPVTPPDIPPPTHDTFELYNSESSSEVLAKRGLMTSTISDLCRQQELGLPPKLHAMTVDYHKFSKISPQPAGGGAQSRSRPGAGHHQMMVNSLSDFVAQQSTTFSVPIPPPLSDRKAIPEELRMMRSRHLASSV